MARWLRLLRGILVTGITFAIVAGVGSVLIGVPLWLVGAVSFRGLAEIIARFCLISCANGVAFSALVAGTARGQPFRQLSLPHFAALGAGLGFVSFIVMGATGAFARWPVATAITDVVVAAIAGPVPPRPFYSSRAAAGLSWEPATRCLPSRNRAG